MTLLARGQIKIDANKARDKLRDHMLVDLDLYATELARAAVALGATTLDVRWDVDDVVLTMGPLPLAPTPDELESIRDRVVGAELDERGAALRLLGIGVNAALGLDPAFVEVAAAGGAVRFARDAAPARRARAAEPIAADFLRVQIRRRVGLDLLERALRREPPRPVRCLLERADRIPLRLTIDGVAYVPSALALERIELGGPGPTRAWLELHPADTRVCSTLFFERGVEMTRYGFVGRSEQPLTGDAPLRVVIDAHHLPTNASRSAIRLDDPALRVLLAQVSDALDRLLASLRASESEPHRAALAALVSWLAVRRRAGEALTAIQREALQLPLLRSAYGDPMSIEDIHGGSDEAPLLVHGGASALPRELEALVGPVLWPRGSPAERCLDLLVCADASERVARAQLGLQRRARVLARPPRAIRVPNATSYVLLEEFRVDDGPFTGLHGQIALHRSNGVDTSSVQAWIDGHPLEVMPLPGTTLPFELALTWDRFRASLDYTTVQRNAELTSAIAYAWSLAAFAACARVEDPALARLAFASWRDAMRALGEPDELPAPLADRILWPCADGTMVSARHVAEYVAKTQVLCVARCAGGPAPDRRPVLSMPACAPLVSHFAKAVVVDYGADLLRAEAAPAEPDRFTSLAFGAAPLLGSLRIGTSRMYVHHAGRLVHEAAHDSRYGDVDVVYDDQAAVPAEAERRFLWSSPRPALTDQEDSFLAAMLQRVEQQPAGSPRLDAAVALYFVQSAQRIRARLARPAAPHAMDSLETMVRIDALTTRFEQEARQGAKAALLAKPAVEATPTTDAPRGHFEDHRGSVLATLPTNARAARSVFTFQGRLLCERPTHRVPVDAHVDVQLDELVDSAWQGLDKAGTQWAHRAILRASAALLRRHVSDPRFSDDRAALELTRQLLDSWSTKPQLLDDLRAVLAEIQWPTMLGRHTRIANGAAPLRTCSRVYRDYAHPRGDQDPDAIHLPEDELGTLRRSILLALGQQLVDVSEPVAKTQALRTRFGGDEPRYTDTFGRSHAVSSLVEHGDVFFTSEAEHAGLALEDRDTPILLLGPREIAAIRQLLEVHGERTLVDASLWLNQERAARSKVAVSSRAATRLPDALRSSCDRFEAVKWKYLRMRGEIGLLAASATPQRRVVVHGGGRPLCEMDAPSALPPFVAVVDIERVRATRAFDGFEFHADAARVLDAVVASVRLMASAPAPRAAEPSADLPAEPAPNLPVDTAGAVDVVIEVEAPEPPKQPFFVGLWRKALAVLVPPPPPADATLVHLLAERIAAMQLVEAGVSAVLEYTPQDRSARPLTLDASTGQLRVNLHDASVRALAATELGQEHLALAALSEINRERGAVTDAHERAVLMRAMRRLQGDV